MSNVAIIEEYYKEQHFRWVKRLSRRVPSEMDAEDVVQEAFTQALTYQHTYNPELSSIATWFTNIVNNVHRRMKRHDFLSCEIKEEDWYTKEADEYECDELTCKRIVDHISTERRESHRNILFSHYIVGNKVGQVALQLDVPVETV